MGIHLGSSELIFSNMAQGLMVDSYSFRILCETFLIGNILILGDLLAGVDWFYTFGTAPGFALRVLIQREWLFLSDSVCGSQFKVNWHTRLLLLEGGD